MNCLVAVDFWFADVPGGAARVARDCAGLLRDRGHHVAVLCIRGGRGRDAPPVRCEDGLRIVRYDKPVLPAWHPAVITRNAAAAAQAARRHLADRRWDVVHIHSHFTGAGVVEAFGAGPRYVMTVHSPIVLEQRVNWAGQGWVGRLKLTFGQGMLRRLEARLLNRCDAIHALSDFTRGHLEAFHGVGRRVTVIPYWCRPELRRTHTRAQAREQLDWPGDETIVLTVRQLRERYGIDLALEALAPALREGRCRFIIGGEGALEPRLRAQAAALGVSERVTFAGRLSDDQLKLAYEAADLFVLPTRALECFGLIVIEAMAFGCPVIATDAGAIPEVLRGFPADVIVPAGDVAALRSRLEDFLAGRLRLPDQEQITRFIGERYGADRIVPRIVELLEGSRA